MGRRQLSDFEKGQIVTWREAGDSLRTIAAKLNRSAPCILKFLQKFESLGTSARQSGSGRPKKTSERDDRAIVREVQKDRFVSAKQIKANLNLSGVHERTIRNRIREHGMYRSYWSAKKPFISKENRRKRLLWAQNHLHWTLDEWRSVLWSDESPFVLVYSGKRRVWRRENERYLPSTTRATVKHDKKINVWGCFSARSVGRLYRIVGNLDQVYYKKILQQEMIPSAQDIFGDESWIFQQDNDPKHTAKSVQNYLRNKSITVLDWPSQSPDLNPIENLWSYLEHSTIERKPKSEAELFEILEKAWEDIPAELLHSLVESMPRRCQAVIDAKGYATKY
jgi:transposase